MKNSIKIISALALTTGLGLAQSTMAATVPYLYVYSIPGSGGAPGMMTATLKGYTAGDGSTVGLPSALPYNGPNPVIIQNGKMTGPVSATLVYHVTLGSTGQSDCTLSVASKDIGLPAAAPNGTVSVLDDSGGMGLCTDFLQSVSSLNPQDGDQVISLNWKSK